MKRFLIVILLALTVEIKFVQVVSICRNSVSKNQCKCC